MKTLTFTVRMPIRDDADPADAAEELLRYGVSGVEQGVEIVPGTMRVDGELSGPSVIAAVDALIAATQAWNIYPVADNPDVQARRRELLALIS